MISLNWAIFMRICIFLLMASLGLGCGNDSSFKGDTKRQKNEPVPTPLVEIQEPVEEDLPEVEVTGEIEEPQEVEIEVPENAVVAGSFTAFTTPTQPLPGQKYIIVIKVKLPSNISNYDESDLSGKVIGTDNYVQGIGRSKSSFNKVLSKFFKGKIESFEFSSPTAVLRVAVPGAANLVKDTIEIHSDVLNESQTLTLQFKKVSLYRNTFMQERRSLKDLSKKYSVRPGLNIFTNSLSFRILYSKFQTRKAL